MNKSYILSLVNEYVDNDGNLGIKKFEEFFGALDEYEQEEIEDILNNNSIQLVDDINWKVKSINSRMKNVASIKRVNLTNEQLCLLYQEGNEEAISLLTIKNERLLYSRAYKFNRISNHKLDIEDLVQYGFIGMLDAANKFDINKGAKFVTYAIWWIDQKITRGIVDSGFTIRLPVYIFERVQKIQNIYRSNEFLDDIGIRKIVKMELGYSDGTIDELLNLSKQTLNMTSLYTDVGEDEDTYLVEFLEDQYFDVEKEIDDLFLKEEINHILSTLTLREKYILQMRFGLNGHEFHTLEEIGSEMSVTKERIRQIEAKALRKLRHPSRSKYIRGYIEYER